MEKESCPSIDLDLNHCDVLAALELRRRDLSDAQLRRFESYAAEIFGAFGLDLDTPAMRETPRRFIRALYDATAGYDGDPKLLTVFDTECRGVSGSASPVYGDAGAREVSPLMRTTFWRGRYDHNPALRAEFLSISGCRDECA